MDRRFLHLAAAALSWLSLDCACNAQLIQVGPGYVRAPFVRVYSYPDGGSYVRAPFVGVFTPGYSMPSAQPALPTANDLRQMSWSELAQALRETTALLNADLARFSTTIDWRPFLKTSEITTLLLNNGDAPPSEEVRLQLQEALDNFHAAHSTSAAQDVTRLTSFQLVEAFLGEYVLPPEARLRRQLFSAAEELSRSLNRYSTGSDWQQYLALSPGMALSQTNLDEPLSPQRMADLTQAREHFDAATQSDEYRKTTNLPAFVLTRQLLTAYLQLPATPHSQPAEELPVPGSSEP